MSEPTNNQLQTVACIECGKPFEQTRHWSKFCTPVCRARYSRMTGIQPLIDKYLLTVQQAASMMQCSETTIRKRIKLGNMRTERILGRVLVYRKEIAEIKGK